MLRSLKLLPILCLALSQTAWAQEINVLTDLDTPFPPGCISLALPEAPVDDDNTLIDGFVDAPTVNSDSLDGEVQVTVWRVGCADEGYSVVMIRLQRTSGGDPILVPQVYAQAGTNVGRPDNRAHLVPLPAIGNAGASGDFISTGGTTYMLAVEREFDGQTTFLPADYNDLFTLELYWGAYSPGDLHALLEIGEYLPEFDPPQTDKPILNGRYSGQYVIDGKPNQGLVIQVAERRDGSRYVFVIMFTYIDGQAVWVVGNTAPSSESPSRIEVEMVEASGGDFFTNPPGTYDGDDISAASYGTLTLEAMDCNTLAADYDFVPGGFGTGSITFERLIRIAGYDCNPWE